MPETPIPIQVKDNSPIIGINSIAKDPTWKKTFNGKHIPFPENEDPKHVHKVRKKLPRELAHLEGFFSKKASTKLPPNRPRFDMVLELEKPMVGKPA